MTSALDTLQTAADLEAAGIPASHAKAIVGAIARARADYERSSPRRRPTSATSKRNWKPRSMPWKPRSTPPRPNWKPRSTLRLAGPSTGC